MNDASDVTKAFTLWFFRDLEDEQRYKLGLLCGLPGEAWPTSQVQQQYFLKHTLAALGKAPAPSNPAGVRSVLRRAKTQDCSMSPRILPMSDLEGVKLRLSPYDVQVLIGTSISGCNMSPDRVFDLNRAWQTLYSAGLIDRADGIAYPTKKGEQAIEAILSALSPSPVPAPLPGSGETKSNYPEIPDGWHDIASAPKDGTWLDLWAGDRRVTDVRWAENDEPDDYGFTGGWVNVKGEFALGEDEPPMFWMRVERPSPANADRGHYDRDGYCDNPVSIDLNNLNDEITSILDEHDLSQALQDSLHEDIAELIWSVVNASGNYVADHDTYPKEVHFSNGRIVRISANGPHLVIDQVADSSYVTALSLEQGEKP